MPVGCRRGTTGAGGGGATGAGSGAGGSGAVTLAHPRVSSATIHLRPIGPQHNSCDRSVDRTNAAVITHPEKVLFPDSGITKGELCAYYEAIAPLMLPHITGRPVTMERYPAGIDKKGFIQKDVSKGFPDWLERVEVGTRNGREGRTVHYPLAADARSLV